MTGEEHTHKIRVGLSSHFIDPEWAEGYCYDPKSCVRAGYEHAELQALREAGKAVLEVYDSCFFNGDVFAGSMKQLREALTPPAAEKGG